MRELLLIIALFCPASLWAVVPIQTCTASGSVSISCNIASVGQHHLIVAVVFVVGDSTPVTYTDTPGNSFSQNPFLGCVKGGNVCNTGVAMAQSYSIAFAPFSGVTFYSSTGTFSGSDTFTAGGGATGIRIVVGEYGEDLLNIDVGKQGNSPATSQVTTTGANDLIISMSGDSGVATCSSTTPASGFTSEFTQTTGCLNYADRIDLPPGTYTAGSTKVGGAVPGYTTTAFGVAPFVSTGVRHARNVY